MTVYLYNIFNKRVVCSIHYLQGLKCEQTVYIKIIKNYIFASPENKIGFTCRSIDIPKTSIEYYMHRIYPV